MSMKRRGVRVIAGSARGRRLVVPEGTDVRPTKDMVREAVFSALGARGALVDAQVLDLYAGSGALGIEALSRGARDATFVDSDAAAARAVRENLDRVGSDRARVFRADVLSFLRGAARHRESWDLVLCDPPYRLAHRLGPALGPLLVPVLGAEARIVCESSAKHPLRLDLPVIAERRYGYTALVIHGTAA